VLFATSADGWLANGSARQFAGAAAAEGIAAPTAPDHAPLNAQGRYGIRQKFLIEASDKLNILVAADVERENDSLLAGSTEITQLFGPGNWGPNTTAAQQLKVPQALSAVGNLRSFGG